MCFIFSALGFWIAKELLRKEGGSCAKRAFVSDVGIGVLDNGTTVVLDCFFCERLVSTLLVIRSENACE